MLGNALRACRLMWLANWGDNSQHNSLIGSSIGGVSSRKESCPLKVPCPVCLHVNSIEQLRCPECEKRHELTGRHPQEFRRSLVSETQQVGQVAGPKTAHTRVNIRSTVKSSVAKHASADKKHPSGGPTANRPQEPNSETTTFPPTTTIRRFGPFVDLVDDGVTNRVLSADAYQFFAAPDSVSAPTQTDIDRALTATVRVIVLAGGTVEGRPVCTESLAEVHDPITISQLKKVLRVRTVGESVSCCSCLGGPTIQLIDRHGRVTHLTLHHEHALRLQGWDADALLERPSDVTAWLEDVGIPVELIQELYANRYRLNLPLAAPREPNEATAQALIRTAVKAEECGDLGMALARCDAAIEVDPDMAFAYAARGRIRIQIGSLESCVNDCTSAIDLGLETVDVFVTRAAAYAQQEMPEMALLDLDRAMEVNPYSAIARNSRGLMHARLGLIDQAVHDFRHAAELVPGWALAQYNLAYANHLAGDDHAALQYLNRAIVQDPNMIQAILNRGHLLASLERHEKALADFDRVIVLVPDCGEAWLGRAEMYLRLGAERQAMRDYERAAHLIPERADELRMHASMMICNRCVANGEIQRAEQTIDEALAIWGEVPELLECRAVVSWFCGRLEDAVYEFSQVITELGAMGRLLSARGQVLAEARRFAEARLDLTEAVRLARREPDDRALAYALNGLGFALGGLGYFEDALGCFEESISLCPDNAWVYHNRAIIFHRMGYLDRCLGDYEQALSAGQPALLPRMERRANALLEEHGWR